MGITGPQSRCWQGWFFLEAVGENLFPCLFHLLEAAHILCSWSLFPWFMPGGTCLAHSRSSLLRPVLKPGHQSQYQTRNFFHFPAACPACDRITKASGVACTHQSDIPVAKHPTFTQNWTSKDCKRTSFANKRVCCKLKGKRGFQSLGVLE